MNFKITIKAPRLQNKIKLVSETKSNLFQKLRKVLTTNHIFFTLKSFEEYSSTEKTQVLHSCLIKLEKQVRTCFNNLQLLSKCCTFLFIVSRTFLLLLL